MFTQPELDILNNAIDMLLSSNKRMANSKPQFADMFRKIEADVLTLKNKINTAPVKNK